MSSTLYTNAKVLTMDSRVGTTNAFLVDGDRIVAVGERALAVGSDKSKVDLGGKTVVPGLIDAHAHLETDAVSHAQWVDIRDVPMKSALDRLRRHAATLSPGEWIVGQATFGQDTGLPTRHDLDAAAPDNPTLFRASMHAMSANTAALRAAGLLNRVPAPTGTIIERDSKGVPTGRLMEAHHLFPLSVPTSLEVAEMIAEEVRLRFNRYGVTSVYEVPMSRQGVQAFQLLERENRLNVRMSLSLAVKPGLQPLIEDISQWASTGIMTGFGNDNLWLGAAKYFLDGAYHASYLSRRAPRNPRDWGALTHLYPDVVRGLVTGYDAGIQVWFHALGEDAQLLAMDATAEAQQIFGGDAGMRTRIEHIFNDFPTDKSMLERLASSNIIPVPNPTFIHFFDEKGQFPYRTLIEQGFMPPGNSDNSGTQPFANNPWFGIAKMVGRRNKFGNLVSPDEQISVYDALRTYTEFGAYAGHREGKIGVIAEGAFADFAVLNGDPFIKPVDELDEIESELTVLGGREVWST